MQLQPKLRKEFSRHSFELSVSRATGATVNKHCTKPRAKHGQARLKLLSPILEPRCLGTSFPFRPPTRCQVDVQGKLMDDEMGQDGRVTCSCRECACEASSLVQPRNPKTSFGWTVGDTIVSALQRLYSRPTPDRRGRREARTNMVQE